MLSIWITLLRGIRRSCSLTAFYWDSDNVIFPNHLYRFYGLILLFFYSACNILYLSLLISRNQSKIKTERKRGYGIYIITPRWLRGPFLRHYATIARVPPCGRELAVCTSRKKVIFAKFPWCELQDLPLAPMYLHHLLFFIFFYLFFIRGLWKKAFFQDHSTPIEVARLLLY